MKLLLVSGFSAAVLFASLHWWRSVVTGTRKAIAAVVVLLVLAYGYRFAHAVAAGIAMPPIYDLGCFWVFGRVAVLTHHLYDPAAFHAIGDRLKYAAEWNRETLDPGFIYPPVTIFLFAPLGFFISVNAAAPFWYAFLMFGLAAAIIVLARYFLAEYGAAAYLIATALALSFPPVFADAKYAQTIFLVLLFAALFCALPTPRSRGISLALACVVKPVAAGLAIYPLVRRSWTELSAACVTLGALFAGAVLFLGWGNLLPYFSSSPYGRYPAYALADVHNQSLYGAVLRLTHRPETYTAALHQPLYLVPLLLIIAGSTWLGTAAAEEDRDISLSLLLAASLLVYPQTSFYYAVLILIPILAVWRRRGALPHGAALAGGFAFLEFALTARAETTLLASMFAWLFCATFLAHRKNQQAEEHALIAPGSA